MRMTSLTTEDYETGGYHSCGSLEHLHKRKHKRAINSEPFLKPLLNDSDIGSSLSCGSLEHPRKRKHKRAINSEPFIKPNMSTVMKQWKEQFLKKIISHIPVKVREQQELQDPPKRIGFSLNESKDILREIAAELDRLLQLRGVSILMGVTDSEISEDEGQSVILLWDEELRIQEHNTKSINLQAPADHHASNKDTSQKLYMEQRTKGAGTFLSVWTKNVKRMQKEPVSLREEYKVVVKELYKQWKKGHLVNILPIMDFIIKTILQDDKSEEYILKQWFKSEKMFKKAGAVRIPDPIWNWITRPSANVILDPETANPELLLSEDGKVVRSKTHSESKSSYFLHRRHSKFDGWTCVQAADGYTTGRHYWEVDVKGIFEWRIGVVKDSAPRHGFVNMNTTAGYWTLRLQLGSLMALTDPVTKLDQPTPTKIGVYLDVEEGQVSFYETKKRRRIYTFKTNFRETEKIYPVFGTVETNRALQIM